MSAISKWWYSIAVSDNPDQAATWARETVREAEAKRGMPHTYAAQLIRQADEAEAAGQVQPSLDVQNVADMWTSANNANEPARQGSVAAVPDGVPGVLVSGAEFVGLPAPPTKVPTLSDWLKEFWKATPTPVKVVGVVAVGGFVLVNGLRFAVLVKQAAAPVMRVVP